MRLRTKRFTTQTKTKVLVFLVELVALAMMAVRQKLASFQMAISLSDSSGPNLFLLLVTSELVKKVRS